MRKRLITLLSLLFVLSSLFSAAVPQTDRLSVYLRGTLSPSLVCEKAFSYPASNGNIHFALGVDISADIYRNDSSAKWGFSTSLYSSYPLVSKEYENFASSDITDRNPFLLFLSGLVFRCTPSAYVDMSIALRTGILSYDLFSGGIILALSTEPRVDLFLSDSLYLSGGFSITDGLIRFTPSNSEKWYENGYTTLLLSLKFGVGYRFGGDRKR